ncbi:hypothetical protein BH10PSE18_BH10PSE18_20770 [soil metagenome]
MPRGLIIVAMVAMLMAAAGLMLWQWAVARQARKLAAKHLAQQMNERLTREETAFDIRRARSTTTSSMSDPWAAAAAVEASAIARKSLIDRVPLPTWLRGAVTARALVLGALVALIASGLTLAWLGGLAATAVFVLLTLLGIFVLWMRVQKTRKKLISQLPGFIDSMVRLITIGNSAHAAFQLSVATAKTPLRDCMEGAASLVRAGVELDQALNQMANGMDIEELYLLASILGLGIRYGGRTDMLLERVAAFMRDREQAEEELNAMSAETRLSAWILSLLPLGMVAVIMFLNPEYFRRMLGDATGQTLLMGAFGLQVVGVLLLYRLARLA